MGRIALPLGRGRSLTPGSPTAVMGILNLTPDSFSDGGRLGDLDAVRRHAEAMIAAGVDVLDLGGESTRPRAAAVSEQEELDRVLPALEACARTFDVPLSIDTRKRAVFEAAWAAGASILNDVSGGRHDPGILEAAAGTDAAVILMHMRGEPDEMDGLARYDAVVAEVRSELQDRVDAALAAGVSADRIVLDPGLGFAKRTRDNVELVRHLEALRLDRFPLLLGASRKRFLGELCGQPDARRRDPATAIMSGHFCRSGVEMVRVHDVASTVEAIALTHAIWGAFAEGER
jgi:dihydropteroate synthase